MARRPRSTAENPTINPRHMLMLLRETVPPVHPAGIPFVSAGLGLALFGRRSRWLRRTGLLTAGASAGFFRHPPRVPPGRSDVVVAPADGQVCLIESAAPPPELEMGTAPLTRVSIFLSVFDAHVQRAPIGGEVIAVQHRPGLFGSADLPVASDSNERNSVRIRAADGTEVVAVQIAGLVARRIVCNVRVGDTVSVGDTYGLIRFGSRLDTYLPADAQVSIRVGQRAVAGETVLAQLP